jgi:hypothetical protein
MTTATEIYKGYDKRGKAVYYRRYINFYSLSGKLYRYIRIAKADAELAIATRQAEVFPYVKES